MYGSPRLNNKDDPVDELVFILLSQMTTGPSYERVFDRLKATVQCWDGLLSTELHQLKALIGDAGLANQKAPRILSIARRLAADFGRVTLAPVDGWSDRDVERYLTSLPGVGVKSAKCVMMYALGRKVLPVDTHVGRVATRLGLTSKSLHGDIHNQLEAIVTPKDRYAFHVNGLVHGREVCRAVAPRCAECQLSDLCPSAGA